MAKTVSRARVMWIEADPVFGGSRSQVQFPAELSGFFGLPRNPPLHTAVRRGVIFAALDFPADTQLDHFRNARHYTNLCFTHNLSRRVCCLFSGAAALSTAPGLNG